MKRGYLTLAVVGIAAAVAVFGLSKYETSFLGNNMNLSSTDKAFADYMVKHGKQYATKEEYLFRKDLFEQNQAMIAEHNSQNGVSWYLKANQFSDMTKEEIKMIFSGYRAPEQEEAELPSQDESHLLTQATPVDWRSRMPAVKNQGNCGSCWAFAAIGSLEGRYAIRYNSIQTFSEQQMVDCSTVNYGCQGGWPSRALQYTRTNGA